MTGALAGLRVVEVGGVETLYAGKLLADQGADVTLVEPVDGHRSRRLPPYAPSRLDATSSVRFAYLNGNKSSVVLALDSTDGRAALAKLAHRADVVLAGGRPADIRALGLDPDTWTGRLLVAVTPFGWTGPWADLAADELVLNALGGMVSLGGYADGRPLQPPIGVAYAAAGLFTATATAAMLVAARPEPSFVDVSVHECVVMGLENAAQFYDLEGRVRSRTGGVDPQVGRGVYACKDGYVYLMLGLSAGSAFWHRFLAWLDDWDVPGREALQGVHWFERPFLESAEAIATFRTAVRPLFADHTKDELYTESRARSIPLAPVNTVADLLTNEQFRARDFFVEVGADDWSHGPAVAPGPPYRMTGAPWAGRYAPPDLGAVAPLSASETSLPWPTPDGRDRSSRPLDGLRVVDFSWVGAGSYTTRILADLGADVVKIESSSKVDQIRMSPPFRDSTPGPNRSGYFADRNASKRSITLNLKHPDGKRLALDLIAEADIVANNFSPGTMERLGLGYDDIRQRQPRIVYLEMSMQGRDGPHAQHVGYGLTIAALGGFHSLVGAPGREPIGTGTNYPDHIPSPGHAAFAVMCALVTQRRSGVGQRIELAQVEATVAVLGADVMAASLGVDRAAQENLSMTAVLHDTFGTREDDGWIAISAQSTADWRAVCDVLGLPDVVAAGWLARIRPTDEYQRVRAWIEDRTAAWDGYELMTALQAARVRAGVVQSARQVVDDDPQLRHRDHWVRIAHFEAGEFLYNCLPFRISGADVTPRSGAPLLGEHTHQVLRDAGLSDAEIADLDERGVLD